MVRDEVVDFLRPSLHLRPAIGVLTNKLCFSPRKLIQMLPDQEVHIVEKTPATILHRGPPGYNNRPTCRKANYNYCTIQGLKDVYSKPHNKGCPCETEQRFWRNNMP